MEVILIKEGSAEWEYLWTWLEQHPINKGIVNPSIALNNGEAWQYMGSWKQNNQVIHTLRHRNHPTTQGVYELSLMASNKFTEDQIESTKKVR